MKTMLVAVAMFCGCAWTNNHTRPAQQQPVAAEAQPKPALAIDPVEARCRAVAADPAADAQISGQCLEYLSAVERRKAAEHTAAGQRSAEQEQESKESTARILNAVGQFGRNLADRPTATVKCKPDPLVPGGTVCEEHAR